MSLVGELITARELARSLKISVETIWRYTREKRIPYVEVGSRQYRYRKGEVLEALSEKRPTGVVREDSPPYQGKTKLTYEDYAGVPEEAGYQYELIDGVLVRDPTPSFHHQRVSRRLQRLLEDYFWEKDPGGELFNAPLDLALGEYTVIQPDLLYLPGSRPARRMPLDTLPELVVEILSPSTSRKDRVTKLNHYQAAGIPHYWIVDPDDGLIEAYQLREGLYIAAVRACEGAFSHPAYPGLTFDVEALFSKPGME